MDKKTSQLTELIKASITDADILPIVNAGETKKISIATFFSKIDDAITAALDAYQNSLGLLILGAATTIPNTISTVFSKIKIVDTLSFDKINNHITNSFLNDNSTINTDGVYELSVFGSFTAPQNSVITFARYKNDGVLGGGAQAEFIGQGNTPVQITGTITVELVDGDVIDIRAKADSADTLLTIGSMQYKLEKTHF